MLIGLSGYARSGKDTVADYLVKNYGFTRMAFADPIREALYRLDPKVTFGGMPEISLAWAVDKSGWEVVKDESPEVRGLLQRMGTEVARNMFGEDFWVDYAIGQSWKNDNVVFSDVRFRNEAKAIEKNWGQNWRVNRTGAQAANAHVSETQMDDYKEFDTVLNNDSSKEALYEQIDKIMELNKNEH
jgi:hypothetical protein